MFILASYPRSGNTFFRNVLYEVYGIESVPYSEKRGLTDIKNSSQFLGIKTHSLPEKLPNLLQELPAVYIIRDARDSIVSTAYQRINRNDGLNPSFNRCLLENILAQKGHHFGGWSENVKQWSAKAELIIHFENLIKNPIQEIEKIRAFIDLPTPNEEKIPSFEFLKSGKGKYPNYKNEEEANKKAPLFFRKGKIGGWKKEIPKLIYILFINIHGETMNKNGYDLFPDDYKAPSFLINPFIKNILILYFKILLKLRIY